MKKVFMLMIAIIAIACTKTTTNVFVNGGFIPYYGWNIPTNANGECMIYFGNYIPVTKATSENGHFVGPNECGYDSFKMFAFKDGEPVMNPYLVEWDGNQWTYEVNSQELQYFDRNSAKYDFIGVIADNASNDNGTIKVEAESFMDNTDETDTPKEVLYSITSVEKSGYNAPVSINFNHINSKMYIGFASDRSDTELLDYAPGNPGSPAIPGTPATETYTKKTVKFIDELVAGNEVQVGIGFIGANSPKLTKNNPNPLYVGSNNATLSYMAKDWLLSIKDAVNAQFVYYKLDQVSNSTSKTETTEDWESAASNKNIFMMKLADGVDKAAFAAGNDAFATALKAHQTDWVGGSPAESFWAMFEQAYADGWRVIRINVNDANANQVLVFLSSNLDINTQVCEVTPGTPDIPAVPATPGIDGIRVFSVDYGANSFVKTMHTTKALVSIKDSCDMSATESSADSLEFVIPTGAVAQFVDKNSIVVENSTFSPSVYYALPVDNPGAGYVVKFSYVYNGVSYYDARVNIPAVDSDFTKGYYYKYVIYITSNTNGTTDPTEAATDKDEVDTSDKPITFNVIVTRTYENGKEVVYEL